MSDPPLLRRDLLRSLPFGAAAMSLLPTPVPAQPASADLQPFLFNVRAFGATGDSRTIDTPAIQRAIEAAAAAGGGTVYFPAGVYLSFSIRLRSNVHLVLSQGCVLLAADSPLAGSPTGYNGGTYDAAEPKTPWDAYQDYGHNHWHNSLLWGESLHDLSITGPGLIWGRGLSNGRSQRDQGNQFVAEQAGVGNKAIALKECRNVLVRDISILKGGHFGLLFTGVDNVTIDNLRIDTDRDGIDLDCCRNVRVSNCAVNSPWDDGICPKSSFALGYARATENVTITNCYVTGDYQLGSMLDGTMQHHEPASKAFRTGRVKCGTESNSGFRNITISNCIFEGCQGLALESVDGALLEDIAISNITMRNISTSPIFLRLGARLRGPAPTRVGALRRILISNLSSYNTDPAVSSVLTGIPGYALEDIHLSNIYIEHRGQTFPGGAPPMPPEAEKSYPEPTMFGATPSHGFFFRHIRRLDVRHVEVRPTGPEDRPAFVLDDIERVDFLGITAPAVAGAPAFLLRQVRDLRVLSSRAAKDTILPEVVSQAL